MMLSFFLGLVGVLPRLVNPKSVGVGLCIFFVVLVGSIALRPYKAQIWGFVLKLLNKKPKTGHNGKVDGNRSLQDVIKKREAADKEIVKRVTDQCKETRTNLGVGNPENCSTADPCKFCKDIIQQAKTKSAPKIEGMAKL